jgi:hypothetical protein
MFSTEVECSLIIEHLSISIHTEAVACDVQAGGGGGRGTLI